MDQKQFDEIVEIVTRQLMDKLTSNEKKILVLGKDENCKINKTLSNNFNSKVMPNLDDVNNFDFVVLPVWYLNKLRGDQNPNPKSSITSEEQVEEKVSEGETIDLTGKKLIHERELKDKYKDNVTKIIISKKAITTQLAKDFIRQKKLEIIVKD